MRAVIVSLVVALSLSACGSSSDSEPLVPTESWVKLVIHDTATEWTLQNEYGDLVRPVIAEEAYEPMLLGSTNVIMKYTSNWEEVKYMNIDNPINEYHDNPDTRMYSIRKEVLLSKQEDWKWSSQFGEALRSESSHLNTHWTEGDEFIRFSAVTSFNKDHIGAEAVLQCVLMLHPDQEGTNWCNYYGSMVYLDYFEIPQPELHHESGDYSVVIEKLIHEAMGISR